MRTALLTWDMPPVPTGLGRAANEIARGLVAAGVDVTVFSADRSGNEETDGLPIVGCRPGSWRQRQRGMACLGHHAMPAVFAEAVKRHGPFDLVEATNWYAPGAGISGTLVVRNSTPAIDAFDGNASLRDRLDLRYAHRLETQTTRRAGGLISNTPSHHRKIAELYGVEDHRLHETIGLSLGDELIRDGARMAMPSAERPGALFVGRAERRKGFDEMLKGFAQWSAAREERPVLRIVGLSDGDLRERREALGLGDDFDVRDLGRASDGEMREAMSASHIVLAPSRYESYGLVYREAAAHGRALVASADDPSASDFVKETGAGVLASATEPDAIATALEEAWRRRDGLRAIGLAHAATLSRRRLGEATRAFYERVLTG